MPGPAPIAGRDDVLASIRRLVLEQATPAPGRLVLTPALRVGPAEPEAEPPPEEAASEAPEPGPFAAAAGEVLDGDDGAAEAPAEGPDAVPPPLVLTAPLVEGPADRPAAGRAQEIEAAVADRPGDWEPDGSEGPEHWTVGEAPPEPVFRHRLRAPEPPAAWPEIDEDRLRALVAEVVREELQGELGERMTRNIRRLVRREIFRVLETREE